MFVEGIINFTVRYFPESLNLMSESGILFQHVLNRNIFMKYRFLILPAILCFSLFSAPVKKHRPVIEVNFAEKVPFSTDFSSSVWKKTPAYPFMKAVSDLSDFHALPLEGGQLRLLYDDNFLYVAAELQDSEVTMTPVRGKSALHEQCVNSE